MGVGVDPKAEPQHHRVQHQLIQTAAKSDPNSSQRPYTEEQESIAKKVQKQAKKGHYDALGVSKNASDSEIKKAYRKISTETSS